MPMKVEIESTADSQFGTNSYLVHDVDSGDAVIIDANFEPELMVDVVKRRAANVKAILLTHTDVDHIAGLPRLMQEYPGARIAVHSAERDVIAEGRPLRHTFPFESPPVAEPDLLEEGRPYQTGTLEFEVLHTPGHSPGGVTLRIGNALFTGDALFAGSVGRTDFHNSDTEALMNSIKEKLMSHSDEFVVLSGHGPISTIGQERRHNPFL
jgi:glyoxylase-like metal-dependent hydrolase (beta-lactamase superfamily II)